MEMCNGGWKMENGKWRMENGDKAATLTMTLFELIWML